MRIVYGVFGYGRGHATRALGVLPELNRRHEVLVVASGDAFDAIGQEYDVVRVPCLRIAYDTTTGRRSWRRTLRENGGWIQDALFGGPELRKLARRLREFSPDVAICDAEPFTHNTAYRLGIPRISFDHFGILAYCRPTLPFADQLRSVRDVAIYRILMGRPQRVIVSSFYPLRPNDPSIRSVGTLLRDEVIAMRPRRGEHLLVYLNNGAAQFDPELEKTLHGIGLPVRVYGTPRRGDDGRVSYCAPSQQGFLEDLATSRAVISTAGNQLVGEAAYFGKPMLVRPENTVEQRMNADAVVRLGFGDRVIGGRFDRSTVDRFLRREGELAENARRIAHDGRTDALRALESFASELARTGQRAARAWRFA